MRGNRTPAIRPTTTETQTSFQALSRGRRTKLAAAAHTTLLKADQWARGECGSPELATALEKVVTSRPQKKG